MIGATVSFWSCFWRLYRKVSIFSYKGYNQSELDIDHLVMSMCRVFSCVDGSGCLLWPVRSVGKTVLAFALLHSVLHSIIYIQFNSVQSCPTLCDPMNRSTPGLPVHHQLLEFTQTHVHRVSDAIQPSHPLSSPSPPALNPSQHQGLFQWVNSWHEVAKVLEFQPQHQSFQWTPRTGLL